MFAHRREEKQRGLLPLTLPALLCLLGMGPCGGSGGGNDMAPSHDLSVQRDGGRGTTDLRAGDLRGVDLAGADLRRPGQPDLGTPEGGPLCTRHFCWENPLPEGNGLSQVAGRTGDLWAVGAYGTVLHGNGTSWSILPSGTTSALHGVWSSGPADAWVVGDGGLSLHWNGSVLSPVQTGTTLPLCCVYGVAPDDVWAAATTSVGQQDQNDWMHTFLHWDGTAWKTYAVPVNIFGPGVTLSALWGGAANDFHAVGTNGFMSRFDWDGTAWTNSTEHISSSSYADVWGGGPGDAYYVVNQSPQGILETSIQSSIGYARANSAIRWLSGSGPADVWATGDDYSKNVLFDVHFDGNTWQELPSSLLGYTFFLDSPGSFWGWTVGRPDILHRGATGAWTSTLLGPGAVTAFLNAVWGTSPDALWAVGNGGVLLQGGGGSWQQVTSGTTNDLLAVWGTAADQMWIVGRGGTILKGDGKLWLSVPSGTTYDLVSVHSSGPTDAWAVGPVNVLHWQGTSWQDAVSGLANGGTAIYSFAPDNVWLFGAVGAAALHFDGTGWTPVTGAPGGDHVWTSGPDDMWTVSVGADFLSHFDGATWHTVQATGASFTGGIWGSGPDDVWATAYQALYHWDGTSLSAIPVEADPQLFLEGVFGLGPNETDGLWTVGSNGAVLRYRP